MRHPVADNVCPQQPTDNATAFELRSRAVSSFSLQAARGGTSDCIRRRVFILRTLRLKGCGRRNITYITDAMQEQKVHSLPFSFLMANSTKYVPAVVASRFGHISWNTRYRFTLMKCLSSPPTQYLLICYASFNLIGERQENWDKFVSAALRGCT